MDFQSTFTQNIQAWKLLNHPFYQDWMEGTLTQAQLQHYAIQYFGHVKAFPQFVSAVHSWAYEASDRKLLFMNLCEEEGLGYEHDHPALWQNFALGLEVSPKRLQNDVLGKQAQALIDCYFNLCRSSYAAGLGALLAYESQVPEMAELKIKGLQKNYGITAPNTLAFWQVHLEADQQHSKACFKLGQKLNIVEQSTAIEAGQIAAQALWNFLSEVHQAPVTLS